MTSEKYLRDVLKPHVRLWQAAMGGHFVFMDNNARLHRTKGVNEYFKAEGIICLHRPALLQNKSHGAYLGHVWKGSGSSRKSMQGYTKACCLFLLLRKNVHFPLQHIANFKLVSTPEVKISLLKDSLSFFSINTWLLSPYAVLPAGVANVC